MRLRFPDRARAHLGYCANVHPIDDLPAVEAALSRWCGPVRERLGAPVLSLGLWLSRRSAATLAGSADARERLADGLAANGLELVTLNGFPYGDFHAERVKEDVYRPDWSDARRFDYTLELARILAARLPDDVPEGTISTLPLGTRHAGAPDVRECAAALVRLALALERLADDTGKPIRVCLEPEPDCLVETSIEAVEFFERTLRPAARRAGASTAVERHLGLCFDACHHATELEDAKDAWLRIVGAGIPVGKVQLSCALALPPSASFRAKALLGPFDEPRFLHQTRRRRGGAPPERFVDLGEALERPVDDAEWRVHFHVPLHWRPEGELRTTSDELAALVSTIAATRPLPHLEVETYTWTVLPDELRPRDDAGLVEGLAREVEVAERLFAACGAGREVMTRPPNPVPLPKGERG